MEQIKIIDGVECFLLNKDPVIYADLNHDLSYYFEGSDFQNQNINNIVPEKNDFVKCGYEWGKFLQNHIIDLPSEVGKGLENTNFMIENYSSKLEKTNWNSLFKKIEEFRQSHSNKWFLPSIDELKLLYKNKNNLKGLTTSERLIYSPYYWSSTIVNNEVYFMYFNDNILKYGDGAYKGKGTSRLVRTRLCVAL